MRIITGDECGLLKECTISRSRRRTAGDGDDSASPTDEEPAWVSKSRWVDDDQLQARSNGVTSLAFLPPDTSVATDDGDDAMLRFRFAALRVDGSVETWEATRRTSPRKDDDGRPSFDREGQGGDTRGTTGEELSYQRICRVPNVFAPKRTRGQSDDDAGDGGGNRSTRPVGIGCAPPSLGRGPMSVACNSVGAIRVLSSSESSSSDSSSSPSLRVVARYDHHVSRPDGGTGRNPSGAKNTSNGASVTAFALGSGGEMAALGGRDRETALVDVATGKMAWKAKNLPPDRRTLLQHPVWTTAIQFLNQPSSRQQGDGDVADDSGGGDGGPILAVGTAYRQLRIYDVRAQRRPTSLTPDGVLPHRITALCQLNDASIAIGDAAGYVHSVDVRKMNAVVGRYVGSAGSVRCMVRHPTLPVLACVGLDRMLRTYDVRSRRVLCPPIYLKQRLNCVLMCMDGTTMPGEGMEDVEQDFCMADLADGALEEEDYVQDYADSSSSDDNDDGDDGEDDLGNNKPTNAKFDDMEDDETSESGRDDEDQDVKGRDDDGNSHDSSSDSGSDSQLSSGSEAGGMTSSDDAERRSEAKHQQRKNLPVRSNKKRRT